MSLASVVLGSDTTQVRLLVSSEGSSGCLHPEVTGATLLVHGQSGPGCSQLSQPFQVASEANAKKRPLSRTEIRGQPGGRGLWPDKALLRPLSSAAVNSKDFRETWGLVPQQERRQGRACFEEACVCGFCQMNLSKVRRRLGNF